MTGAIASLTRSAVGRLVGRRPASPVPHPAPPRGRHLDYAPQLDGQADPGEVVGPGSPSRTTRSRARTARCWSSAGRGVGRCSA
ncbi:hypothetical protein ACFQX7_02540 [Luedemannella flava]